MHKWNSQFRIKSGLWLPSYGNSILSYCVTQRHCTGVKCARYLWVTTAGLSSWPVRVQINATSFDIIEFCFSFLIHLLVTKKMFRNVFKWLNVYNYISTYSNTDHLIDKVGYFSEKFQEEFWSHLLFPHKNYRRILMLTNINFFWLQKPVTTEFG